MYITVDKMEKILYIVETWDFGCVPYRLPSDPYRHPFRGSRPISVGRSTRSPQSRQLPS